MAPCSPYGVLLLTRTLRAQVGSSALNKEQGPVWDAASQYWKNGSIMLNSCWFNRVYINTWSGSVLKFKSHLFCLSRSKVVLSLLGCRSLWSKRELEMNSKMAPIFLRIVPYFWSGPMGLPVLVHHMGNRVPFWRSYLSVFSSVSRGGSNEWAGLEVKLTNHRPRARWVNQ